MNEFLISNSMIHAELFMAVMVLLTIVEGVLLKYMNPILWGIITFVGAGYLLIIGFPVEQHHLFQGALFINQLTQISKLLVLLAASMVLIMAHKYNKLHQIPALEFTIVTIISVLGMVVLISANHFLVLYLGLEMMSLGLYILAAIDRKSPQSAEAGLKYFITGSLSSAVLLYGTSLLYGFTGNLEFGAVSEFLLVQQGQNMGVGMAMLMIMIAMAFKISAVPFHQWTPDVYDGAPTPVVALFATAAKVAAIIIFIRLLFIPLVALSESWKIYLQIMAGLSMLWGAIAGLKQDNIKRLLGYSSIMNMGYIIGTISTTTTESISSVLLFLTIYTFTNIGLFSLLPLLRINGAYIQRVSDLRGLAKDHPRYALGLMILLFSIIGIPPLGGFIGKLFLLNSMVAVQLLHIAFILVLSSVIAAYFYLRIIRTIYFEENDDKFEQTTDCWNKIILLVMVILILVFIGLASPVVQYISTLQLGFGVE